MKGIRLLCLAALVGVGYSQTLVQKMGSAGDISWRLDNSVLTVTGAITYGPEVTTSDPQRFVFRELGGANDNLDIELDLLQTFPNLGIDYRVPLIANVLGPDLIEWSANVNPRICVPVTIDGTTVDVLITNVNGKLRGRLMTVACQDDPGGVLTHKVVIELNDEGGDAQNYLNATAYAFCIEFSSFRANVQMRQFDWKGWGGDTLPKSMGNVNADCCIDDGDLAIVLTDFGTNEARSDLNNDGIVDDTDLAIVLNNFGLCA